MNAAVDRERFLQRVMRLAPILERVLYPRMNSTAACDIQGFMVDGIFRPKELAFTFDGENILHYLFKSPKPFSKLCEEEKKQVRWLERNHHRISYNSGRLSLEEVSEVVQPIFSVSKVFVKGSQKKKYLDDLLLGCEIINLEFDYNCPNLDRTLNDCVYHRNNYCICAKENCKILYEYCINLDL